MKNLLLLVCLVFSFQLFAQEENDELDKSIDLIQTSLEYIKTIEPLAEKGEEEGPLYTAYMCVYTETFTAIMLNNMNTMMRNILAGVKQESSLANYVITLVESDDPAFFDQLLGDSDVESASAKCSQEIETAKVQEYISDAVLKKTISLATLTGVSLGKGLTSK